MTYCSKLLKKYYKKERNKIVFKNGMTLNQLALAMWERLGHRGIDVSILSKVINGKRLLSLNQLKVFCSLLNLKKQPQDELYLALEADYLHRHGLTLFPLGRTSQYNLLERAQKELDLQILCGRALTITKGFGADEVGEAYIKSKELSQQIGLIPQRFTILKGQAEFALARAKLQKASQIGKQFLKLAKVEKQTAYIIDAYGILGSIFYFRGLLVNAKNYLEKGINLYYRQKPSFLSSHSTQDTEVICMCSLACVLWYLGYPDEALKMIQKVLVKARRLCHVGSSAFALFNAVVVHHLRKEAKTTQEIAERLIAIATSEELEHWRAKGITFRGWARVEQGAIEEGIKEMNKGIKYWQATGSKLGLRYMQALLAEAYWRVREKRLDLIEVDKGEDSLFEAELYRIKGELLFRQERAQSEAEGFFRQALHIAQSQKSKMLELKIRKSITRLFRDQLKKGQ